ncbi:hypothetical protein F5X68DRAFT_258128 [Plectosphaerella plurivora]|uniref:Zn(2)-C6 fungal-type domain-containing protein n=1 Tax=Plectosphaerella plurivora TaxID=936078 RepID=A0A9P9AFQ8_9PEZI|nr:hypothetical protein F5X68DRAFT_258128 [Plectosphaerella plurivora]
MPRAARPKTTDQPRGKPRGLRRDRDCASCRQRGVKCDLNRPRCLPCVQEGLPCGGYPQRVVWTGSSGVVAAGPSPTPRVSAPRERHEPEAIKAGWQETDVRECPPALTTLEPYQASQGSLIERLSAFCQHLRRSQQMDQDAAKVPQLVSQVDEFLQARIKTGAVEPPSARSPDGDTAPDHSDFEVHRLATLASLNEVLETADPVAFLAIAVFAFFEVVSDGAFGEWQRHLRGARSLLDYHCHSPAEFTALSSRVPGLSEMLAYFNWWDVVGGVIRRLRRTPGGREEGLIFLEWHRGLMDEDFFVAVGCPGNTFQLFVSLAGWSEEEPGDLHERYVQAMGQLLQLGTDQSQQGQCGDAWRCAAAIAVLTWDDTIGSGTRQAALTCAVDRICQIVAAAPPTSRYYAHMATAVFLAAINASSPDHCGVVETYWRNCQTGEFPRYHGVRAQCEEIWRAKGILGGING